jgi:broad specificity phosphatase PhoE
MSLRLLLIRHGRVDFDALGDQHFLETSRGRQWDPPLDDRGTEQANRLAARLMLVDPPAAVAVSPFRRCRETLAPFLEVAGLTSDQARVVDDLGEVFIGRWEGVRFEDILSGDEKLARRFREQEPMFSLAPGGESGSELRARVVPAVEGLMQNVTDGTAVIVTHGGVINAYLGHVMGIDHDMFFLPDNGSVNSVLVEGDRREVRFLNDVRHLTDPAVFTPPARVSEHGSPRPPTGSG